MVTGAREARTVRLPPGLIRDAIEVKYEKESLNDLIAESLEREVRRRKVLKVLDAVDELSERIQCAHGLHPDSVQMIRELREGIGRRD
jgi:hypothetical protein